MAVFTHPSPMFNHPQADIVISSSDGVEFRMFKLDLSRSSSVFSDMFSLPQPSDGKTSDGGLPIVALSEVSNVLELVLPFCILDSTPTLKTLEDACKVVEPARKYDIKRAMEAAITTATCFAVQEPLKAYALACLHEMDSVESAAALLCLRQPLTQLLHDGSSDEVLAQLSALDYRRLLTYRAQCARAASETLDKWVSYLRVANFAGQQDEVRAWCDCQHRAGTTIQHPVQGWALSPPQWWDDFLAQSKVKLQECSWEGVLKENEAMERFFRSHERDTASCYHDNAAIMRRVQDFIPRLRWRVAESINEIQLEPRDGTKPTYIRGRGPRGKMPLSLRTERWIIIALIFFIGWSY